MAATIAVIGSILVGVLSGWIAGTQSATTASRQLAGETEKSRAEFLRGQRQTSYQAFLAANLDLTNALWEYVNPLKEDFISGRKMPSQIKMRPLASAVNLKTLSLEKQLVNIHLLGTPEVISAASAVYQSQVEYSHNVVDKLDAALAMPSSNANEEYRKLLGISQPAADPNPSISAVRFFLDAARKDMGAGQ